MSDTEVTKRRFMVTKDDVLKIVGGILLTLLTGACGFMAREMKSQGETLQRVDERLRTLDDHEARIRGLEHSTTRFFPSSSGDSLRDTLESVRRDIAGFKASVETKLDTIERRQKLP